MRDSGSVPSRSTANMVEPEPDMRAILVLRRSMSQDLSSAR